MSLFLFQPNVYEVTKGAKYLRQEDEELAQVI